MTDNMNNNINSDQRERQQPRIKVRVKQRKPEETAARAEARPVAKVGVKARKVTFTRTDLPGGDFMMNYYFRRDENGTLVPEDINHATHFERVVYDRDGNTIGSMNGLLSDVIKW